MPAYRSIRVEVHGGDRNAQCIIAFWHGEQLCLYGGVPSSPCVAPVSKSKDGELQELGCCDLLALLRFEDQVLRALWGY